MTIFPDTPVPAERCLFVDDRRENIDAARGCGTSGLPFREPADLRTAPTPLLGDTRSSE